MDALRAQIGVLTDELNTLKAEIVQVKGSHAALHQTSVESFGEARSKIEGLETQLNAVKADAKDLGYKDSGRKPLIKPEQIKVDEFAGSMTDGRARFLEWCEQIKDRVALFQNDMVKALDEAEKKDKIEVDKELASVLDRFQGLDSLDQ